MKKKDFRKDFFCSRKYENNILKIILLYKKCRNYKGLAAQTAQKAEFYITRKAFLNAELGNLDWTSYL